jgi:hypothetical protein
VDCVVTRPFEARSVYPCFASSSNESAYQLGAMDWLHSMVPGLCVLSTG